MTYIFIRKDTEKETSTAKNVKKVSRLIKSFEDMKVCTSTLENLNARSAKRNLNLTVN
jgi:hypothetical protein